jgi:hypothetical protein
LKKRAIEINRAPVVTLWAAIVAERLGYDADEALTLGRAVAGMNAATKAQNLGLYSDEPVRPHRKKPATRAPDRIELLGRSVPVIETKDGLRAAKDGKPDSPDAVRKYLAARFGEHLAAVRTAMEELAAAFPKGELALRAFGLYEDFRPSVPAGERGWGAKGVLDLGRIEALARERKTPR